MLWSLEAAWCFFWSLHLILRLSFLVVHKGHIVFATYGGGKGLASH